MKRDPRLMTLEELYAARPEDDRGWRDPRLYVTALIVIAFLVLVVQSLAELLA